MLFAPHPSPLHLENVGIMDGVIQSTFYRSSMEYYRQVGPAELYFKNAMLYLTYTELSSIPKVSTVCIRVCPCVCMAVCKYVSM